MDYGNRKTTSMRVYPRRRNVAAQVTEELKNDHIRYPSYGGTQKRKRKQKCIIYFLLLSAQSTAKSYLRARKKEIPGKD